MTAPTPIERLVAEHEAAMVAVAAAPTPANIEAAQAAANALCAARAQERYDGLTPEQRREEADADFAQRRAVNRYARRA